MSPRGSKAGDGPRVPASGPIGVVLAGGLGRRIGGCKATVSVNGRPLISYPMSALRRALSRVVIVAKSDTELPRLSGVDVWIEPDEPRHPLAGVLHALSLAEDRPILVCACDLPLVTAELVGALAAAGSQEAPAVLARADKVVQPLLGCYQQAARDPLKDALRMDGTAVGRAVDRLRPSYHEVPDPTLLFNVNTPEDVLRAGALLAERDGESAGARKAPLA